MSAVKRSVKKSYVLSEFDINKLYPEKPGIRNSKIIVCIGKRGTGKSLFILDVLQRLRDIPVATVISKTEPYSRTFEPHIPAQFLHDEYDDNLLHEFWTAQKKKKRKQARDPNFRTFDTRGILVLDDCLTNMKEWLKNKDVSDIFYNGRHTDTTFIFSMQYAMGIHPTFRSNVDYIVLYKEIKYDNLKRLYNYYAGYFHHFRDFCDVFKQCTEDFGCMVIDGKGSTIEDSIFWYRVDKRIEKMEFKCCDPKYWANNQAILRRRYEDEADDDAQDEDYAIKVRKIGTNGNRRQQDTRDSQIRNLSSIRRLAINDTHDMNDRRR